MSKQNEYYLTDIIEIIKNNEKFIVLKKNKHRIKTMSQYIVLSSTYRDRLLYPNPADYIVPYGVVNDPNVNYFNVFRTRNPISFSMPVFNTCWTNWDDNNLDVENASPFTFSTKIIAGNAQKPIFDYDSLNQLLKIGVKSSAKYYTSQRLSSAYNILRNYYVRVTDAEGSSAQRKIITFNPITFEATLDFPLPEFSVNLACEIVKIGRAHV